VRTKLRERRFCANLNVTYRMFNGKEIKLAVTVGYDDQWNAKEVFCADFKSGSDNQALVMDACILLSRLLQHGDTPQDLVNSMCSPLSLIGTICEAILGEQERCIQDGRCSIGFDRRIASDESPPMDA
jgi:hypothetical protein